jgi:uncharacterized protein
MIPLIVFAKAPIPGFAKSRIAVRSGSGQADLIYRELLAATARAVSEFCHHVAFTGSDEPAELLEFFPLARSFFDQSGATLGERLQHAFSLMYRQNAAAAIAIGCDCPYLTGDHFRLAIRRLQEGAEVVIAPATDGGYTLIGCRPLALPVFKARLWGKSGLFSETMAIIHRKGYRFSLLPELPDIDTLDDYENWKKQGTLPLF